MTTEQDTTVHPLAVICRGIQSPEFRQKVAQALPPGLDADRFTRTALTALQIKPELALVDDRQSLYNAIVFAAQQGLMPDGREGAIVVYNNSIKLPSGQWTKQSKAQFQPMVAGVIKRFGDAGVNVYAVSIHANDKVRIWNDDTGQHFNHEPDYFGARGDFIGVVAVAHVNGGTYVEPLNLTEIERIKGASRAKDKDGNVTGPWKDWPDRMAQKSGLHRLGRRVPLPATKAGELLASTLEADRALYDFGQTAEPVTDAGDAGAEPPPPTTTNGKRRPRGLQAAIDSTAERVEPTPPATDPDPQGSAPGAAERDPGPLPPDPQGSAPGAAERDPGPLPPDPRTPDHF